MKNETGYEWKRRAGERADDLVWHRAVAELGLGPELEDLEREARSDADAGDRERAKGLRARLERAEARVLAASPLRRALVLTALLVVGTAVSAGLMVLASRIAIAVASALPGLLGDRPLRLHVAVAHVAVIAVMLVLVASGARPREPQGPVARQAWRQFRRGWVVLWCAWLALYAWLGLVWSAAPAAASDGSLLAALGEPIADLLNVASAAVFFYLFLVLDRPSVKADGIPDRDRTFRRSLFGVALVCGATATLSVLGRLDLAGLATLGPLLGSLLVAISMAFFVGRLSDSHLEVRRALLAPLYFYVAIQVLWHLFVMQGAADELASSLVLCGALALKVYLFALVTRWIQDGELQRYFDEVAFPRLPSDIH